MLFLKFALCLDNFQTYVVYSLCISGLFLSRMGGWSQRKGIVPLGAESSVFRFVAGGPDGLALLWGQISGVKTEIPRLFSLPFCRVAIKFAAFSNHVAFCFVTIETRTGSYGEMCVHVSAGGGGIMEVFRWKTRAGWWLCTQSEWGQQKDGHHRSLHESPTHFGGCSLQRASDCAWCTLGKQASLCRSVCRAPLAPVQPFSRTSGKPWPLPMAKPLSLGDRDQWPLLGCFFTRVPDKCFSGNQWGTQIFDAKARVCYCSKTFTFDKNVGAEKGSGRESNDNLAF